MKQSALLLLFLGMPLLGPPAAAAAPGSLPVTHPKHLTAQTVFDELVRAIGDGRTAPGLRLLPRGATTRNQAVWFSPDQNLVTLEERAYDLCAALQADSLHALAFLLGHELAHYYKDHGWGHDFGSSLADLGVGQQLGEHNRSPTERVRFETEADYFGGFYGHLAGYQALDLVEEILPRIYVEFGLDDELLGYPPLPERQEIARRAREELARMVPVFEAGRLLLLVKRYEEAARCFDFVARTFASREILNNAGVARALEAVELFEEGELNVAYPFELAAETRLRSGSKAAEHDVELRSRLRDGLLRDAREAFERAAHRDPKYLPARVNLAAVADLQGDPEEAEYLARKAIRMARERGEGTALAHGLIVRGIARLRTGNSDGAREDFESAEAGAPSLARLNLAAVDGPAVSPAIEGEKRPARPESIGQATPGRDGPGIVRDPAMVGEVAAVDRSQPAMDIYTRQTAAWNGLVVETGYSSFSFLQTRPGFGGETAGGVRIGDDLSRVEAAYGRPAYMVAGRRGAHHVYALSRIVFRTDESRRVEGWTLYAAD